MPLFIKVIGAGVAALLSIPVYGSPIIGVNYSSPILTHLADIVSGINTNSDIETNAPNWGYGVPLQQVVGVSAAISTDSGTVASSTTYSFSVSALDQSGTTTVGTPVTITTGAAGGANEEIQLTWVPVAGAQGYAVFFGQGTQTSAAGLTSYYLATSSSGYTFSTSTNALSGSYTKTDTTAFADLLQPFGPSYIAGDNGTATGTPVAASSTALELNGGFRSTEVGTTSSCDTQTAGTMFYNTANSHEWGCNGSTWIKVF